VFELKSPLKVNDLRNNDLVRWLYNEFGEHATIVEHEENRIYHCFNNEKRRMVDLHQMGSVEAFEEVVGLIQKKYDNFETECTIITGRGKHVNSNGRKGVLHSSFKQWAKRPELKTMIESWSPYGEGGYKVKLHKPQKLVLQGKSEEDHIQRLMKSILKTDAASQKRLIITHQHMQASGYFDRLWVKAMLRLSEHHGFGRTLQLHTQGNALHLTWHQEGDKIHAAGSGKPTVTFQ
jgi:hypothetical protein